MGLNFNINLPGPFSYSTRVTPDIGKAVRQVNRAARTLAKRDRRCTCSHAAGPRSRPQRGSQRGPQRDPGWYPDIAASVIPPTPRLVRVLWTVALAILVLLAAVLALV